MIHQRMLGRVAMSCAICIVRALVSRYCYYMCVRAACRLYAPVMFNPNGLDSQNVGRDFDAWLSWMQSSVEVSAHDFISVFVGLMESPCHFLPLTHVVTKACCVRAC